MRSKQLLSESLVERIFARLIGIYGSRFLNQYQNGIETGHGDQGVESAKGIWAEELGGFSGNLNAIAYAFENLDSKYPPTALEFRDICRRAPRPDLPKLGYTPTPDDLARAEEVTKEIQAMVQEPRGYLDWARRPASVIAFDLLMRGQDDQRLRDILAQLVVDQRVSHDRKLLQRYDRSAKEWVWNR